MTEEEFIQSPLYRLIQKYLVKKYPWIKGITPYKEFDKFDTLHFIDAIIDIDKLIEVVGSKFRWSTTPSTIKLLGLNPIGNTPYLRLLVTREGNEEQIAKLDEIQKIVEEDVKKLQRSMLVPEEYKTGKAIRLNGYIYDMSDIISKLPN
jgi:hypothetical protein